jgi:transcriptional regulator with XRE-family HTH domain
MHPADIQAALKKNKITQKEIAEALDVSEMAVSLVINKIMVSDRIMKAISEKVQKDPFMVFHEYYLRVAKRSASKKAA